jgi:hypothetical protein
MTDLFFFRIGEAVHTLLSWVYVYTLTVQHPGQLFKLSHYSLIWGYLLDGAIGGVVQVGSLV